MGRASVCTGGCRLVVVFNWDYCVLGIFSKTFRSQVIGGGTSSVYDDFWYGLGGSLSESGKSINQTSAMRLAALASCVLLISADLAKLPLKLKRPKPGGGTEDATDEPLYHLMHDQPNPEMTSFTWRETGQGNILLSGNKFSLIQRSGMGIKAIWPIRPERVQVIRKKGFVDESLIDESGPFRRKRGPIVYQIQGEKEPRPARNILHIPGFGFNGLVGESVIKNFARESIGIGLSQKEFESIFFKQGFSPAGFFTFPGTLGENEEKFTKAIDRRFMGTGSTGSKRPMVLEDDGKFVPYDLKFADSQFIEMMKMTKEDVCGIYRVPPIKIGIFNKGTNYNSTEQQNKAYLDNCMASWIIRDEQAYNSKLLTPEQRRAGYFFKYNLDSLLRPDAKSRSEIDQRYWQMGVPLNTMRERDDLNPIDGGDTGFVPLNFIPVDQAEEPREPAQNNNRELRATALQSVSGRDRVAKRYFPLLRDAAQKIVNRESLAVKKEVNKQTKDRGRRNMEKWLDDFYRTMPDYVVGTIGPTMRSFAESTQEASANEIGADVGMTPELEKEVDDYVDGFTRQYVESSLGQLNSLIDGELTDLEVRVDEWHDKRADKVALDQSVSLSNMVASSVFFASGFSLVWATRGATTCPYCKTLEGRKIKSGGAFAEAGSEIDGEGRPDPLPVYGRTKYPPVHAACDCFVSAS